VWSPDRIVQTFSFAGGMDVGMREGYERLDELLAQR
jgi:hypothetical protein